MTKTSLSKILLAAGLSLALVVAGCNGGGGSSDAVVAGNTGNVAILLTDAPTDIYEEIHVTITAITLLPADEDPDLAPVVLFEGEETIDLLQLQDHAELFEVAGGVPIGNYEKVRLAISLVELVDTDTTPATRREAMLPSDHIDLLTRDALSVSDGNTLYLELDVDTEQSILIVETGSGRLIFRPVVFVTAYEEGEAGAGDDDADDSPLLSVRGLVREIGEDLAVCPSAQANERACVRLVFGDASAIFDANGDPVGMDVLTAGAELVAMGLLINRRAAGGRVLEVLGLLLGTRPTAGVRGGEADSEVDAAGAFTLSNGRTVALDETTPVVEGDGTVVGPAAIQPGQPLTVFGLVQEDPIAAALVILREDDDDDDDDGAGDDDGGSQVTLRGELISVDTADTLQMSVDGVAEPVRLLEDGELIISASDTVEEGDLEDLAGLSRVRIVARGSEGESYFEATRIVAIVLNESDDVVSDDVDAEDEET